MVPLLRAFDEALEPKKQMGHNGPIRPERKKENRNPREGWEVATPPQHKKEKKKPHTPSH